MRISESLVEQYGQSEAVRQLRRESQRVVGINAAIRLRPVEYIAAIRTWRGAIQSLNALGSLVYDFEPTLK